MVNPIKAHINYLRDNPKGYWFKRKIYGWGWTPARWQGWLTFLIFILILIISSTYLAEKEIPTFYDFTISFAIMILSALILIFIAYKKGEKPKWSWGK